MEPNATDLAVEHAALIDELREQRAKARQGGGPARIEAQHAKGKEYDFENFLLMHAMGANTAGQLGSVMAGGVVLALLAGVV